MQIPHFAQLVTSKVIHSLYSTCLENFYLWKNLKCKSKTYFDSLSREQRVSQFCFELSAQKWNKLQKKWRKKTKLNETIQLMKIVKIKKKESIVGVVNLALCVIAKMQLPQVWIAPWQSHFGKNLPKSDAICKMSSIMSQQIYKQKTQDNVHRLCTIQFKRVWWAIQCLIHCPFIL